ncbi:hypothetical protein [Parenemella sanctibonifatiensis]|uniref:hypothetical protein n=1 Tax=Parenemella sanctibonifatiensis TaxID=2016505 RepID=UPI0011865928|nr:hypothetical protein [Parenemella sanctibonifatiensis]
MSTIEIVPVVLPTPEAKAVREALEGPYVPDPPLEGMTADMSFWQAILVAWDAQPSSPGNPNHTQRICLRRDQWAYVRSFVESSVDLPEAFACIDRDVAANDHRANMRRWLPLTSAPEWWWPA